VFQISRVFHLTHVVDDLDATLEWYDDVFGAQTMGSSMRGPTGGNICLLLLSDLVLLPMTPAADDRGALRFRERFGQHLHSLAWFVDDPADLVATLEARGLTLRDELGRPLEGIEHEIWTPPRQAPCLLEFFRSPAEAGPGSGVGLPHDPRFEPGWTSATSMEHPLGIQRTECLSVVAGDAKAAVGFFTDALRGEIVAELAETPWATASTFVRVGEHTVIDVAQPLDTTSRAGADHAANGDILHAATFLVSDLAKAADHLATKGLRLESSGDHALSIDPADSHGVLFRFTDRPITSR
jgi:catechol 2,3-dioxygenase-like lactoylglutathione lyase family enzyme